MKNSEYTHTTEKQLKGVKVITLRDMENGWGRIPAGTICEIEAKWKGLSLITEPCPRCGLSAKISRVGPGSVQVMKTIPKEASVEPRGDSLFVLIKMPTETMLTMPPDFQKELEDYMGRPVFLIADDIDVYIDQAATTELSRMRKQIDEALANMKAKGAARHAEGTPEEG